MQFNAGRGDFDSLCDRADLQLEIDGQNITDSNLNFIDLRDAETGLVGIDLVNTGSYVCKVVASVLVGSRRSRCIGRFVSDGDRGPYNGATRCVSDQTGHTPGAGRLRHNLRRSTDIE